MAEYILGIVGIVFLGVMLDVILPDGEMNKYIKGVFAIVALFVIVSPVQKLFDKNFNLEDVFMNNSVGIVDNDFLIATNKQIKLQLENTLNAEFINNGFENIQIDIDCEFSSSQFLIKKVNLDISKLVINSNMVHINKYAEIKKLTVKFLNVEESDVIINEWRKKDKQIGVFGQPKFC